MMPRDVASQGHRKRFRSARPNIISDRDSKAAGSRGRVNFEVYDYELRGNELRQFYDWRALQIRGIRAY
jgi:hypothetical protein